MSRSRPAGTPSSVITSAWPCDSPALRKRSIGTELYTATVMLRNSLPLESVPLHCAAPMQSRESIRPLDAVSVAPVIEALDAGRDGFPRLIVIDVPHPSQAARILERLRA